MSTTTSKVVNNLDKLEKMRIENREIESEKINPYQHKNEVSKNDEERGIHRRKFRRN